MEFIIVAGLAAAGYYYNNADNERASTEQKVIKHTDMAGLRPYDSDPYSSSVIEQQRAKEQQLADARAQKARDPWRTGMVPENWNSYPGSSTPPLEVRQAALVGSLPPNASILPAPVWSAPVSSNDQYDTFMDHPSINRNTNQRSQNVFGDDLAGGAPIGGWGSKGNSQDAMFLDNSNTHNNMVPFFGAKVTQNMKVDQHQELLETFTGQSKLKPPKREVENMFAPTPSSNVNGQVEAERDMSRYMPSIQGGYQGIKPFEPIKVGRGLNRGPTSVPTGGFHDMYQPPELNVDALRVKTNPKLQYDGRILPPKSMNDKAQLPPNLSQNRPERTVAYTSDNWFKGAAAVAKQTSQPIYEVKPTYRTKSKAYSGPAGPAEQKKEERRPAVQADRRNTFKTDGPRNATQTEGWTVKPVSGDISDYGKTSFANYDNERTLTQCKTVQANLKGAINRETAAPEDVFKDTRKQRYVTNTRQGNVKIKGIKQHPVNNLTNMRTTLKETTIHDTRTGNFGRAAPNKLTVNDPQDLARTTIKETLIHDARLGNLDLPVKNKSGANAYDPEDWRMKTTLREVFPNEAFCNAKKPVLTGRKKAQTYQDDPARTTIKETTIDDGHVGHAAGMRKQTIYDPDDVARMTIKETTIDGVRDGNINAGILQSGRGYITEDETMEAKNVNRQFISDHEHFNNAMTDKGQGYATTEWESPTTLRELTAEYEYTGTAGATSAKATTSQDQFDNAQVNIFREKTLEGRAPTFEFAKVAVGKDSIVAGCQKVSPEEQDRVPIGNKTYAITPGMEPCEFTKDSSKLSGDIPDNRLDPDLLRPLRENPYTIALSL